jgi:hypothetical protein
MTQYWIEQLSFAVEMFDERSGNLTNNMKPLRSHSCLIDGEAVACDDQGIPNFKLLTRNRRYARPNSTPLIFWNSTMRTCASQLERANQRRSPTARERPRRTSG